MGLGDDDVIEDLNEYEKALTEFQQQAKLERNMWINSQMELDLNSSSAVGRGDKASADNTLGVTSGMFSHSAETTTSSKHKMSHARAPRHPDEEAALQKKLAAGRSPKKADVFGDEMEAATERAELQTAATGAGSLQQGINASSAKSRRAPVKPK